MTERNDLLASMEYRCIGPGRWHVEGYAIRRRGRGFKTFSPPSFPWQVFDKDELLGEFRTLTDAVRWIAVTIDNADDCPNVG